MAESNKNINNILQENIFPINFIDLKKQYDVIEEEITSSVGEILKSGRYILGPIVENLENELCSTTGSKYAVSVSSGTDALFITLLSLGIGQGSKVFLPSFTYTATAEVIVLVGATPVFVDVDEYTFNISNEDLVKKIIESNIKISDKKSAILAVDLFGLPADYKELKKTAEKYDLHLISDAAQSFGASVNNIKVGKLADITTTSFYPTKPLGCYGDGGAIFTDNEELAIILKSIRSHGQGADPYDNVRIGVNGRFDSLQAAILLEKLKIFDTELKARCDIANLYNKGLADLVQVPITRGSATSSSWAQYTIITERRDELKEYLHSKNIPTMIYYPKPMHHQSAYEKYHKKNSNLFVSERLSKEVISLPFHPYLNNNQITFIIEEIKNFFANTSSN
ncbi:DegT/DnrJ/EryC1/StrS aminotransferase family protein [Hyphomicrobiales bacterium]|nr:DegT/DnrJ/EryC1/StrS aminotransferase family protein [Hyphomicrobiales bacterium]MDC0139349.1 DegT/DnrJ/EryC1/StrS aminotransferase family protein [Hyphomicrobiales bacterium]